MLRLPGNHMCCLSFIKVLVVNLELPFHLVLEGADSIWHHSTRFVSPISWRLLRIGAERITAWHLLMHHFAASAVASFFASSPVLISKLRDNHFQQSAAWCVCGCSLRVFLQMVQCMRRSTLLRLFTPSKGHGSGRVIAMDSLLLLAQVALTTPSAVSNHGQRSQYIATSPALAKNLHL